MKYNSSPIIFVTAQNNAAIYMKRDDLIPFSFGGNKVRIAEEYFADMEAKNKNCIIAYGNARSNLCRAVANMSVQKGYPCHIISPCDDDGKRVFTNNAEIVKLCGARIHDCAKSDVAETVERVITECEADGQRPYYINGNKFGKGNEATPVRAYAKVYRELKSQQEGMGVNFDAIFLATGTGMTQSGLIAGQIEYGGDERIIGISIARRAETEIGVIKNFVNCYFGRETDCEVCLKDDYLCGGYGKSTDKISDTILYMMTEHGIPLDSTYTGKAFFGMTQTLRQMPQLKNVLFIHTGGTPLFFDALPYRSKQ